MKPIWTDKAISDLARLQSFLERYNRNAAKRMAKAVRQTCSLLDNHPRLGSRLEAFEHAEIRRLILGDYEIRYEIIDENIFILRIWHTREDR